MGEELAKSILNICYHYDMLDGQATYPDPCYKGVQEALLAPASGIFLPEPGVQFLTMMKKGDPIATIVNIFWRRGGSDSGARRWDVLRAARAAQRKRRGLVLLLPQSGGVA